jgi:uncharacterized membrane protein YfcA
MHFDPFVAIAGLIVGFTVGLTGMGGGALMTPILVLLFKVQPLAAVSSDLVAAMVMKPVGGGVHLRRGTVNRQLVLWLMIGSVPAAFLGVLVLRLLGSSDQVEARLKLILGITLLVASAAMVAKAYLQARRIKREMVSARRNGASAEPQPFRLRKSVTLAIGALGGLVVGMTSVGSGSLIIIALMMVYPYLSTRELVGTDLVQAIPLVASAAIGHILLGDFQLSLTASLLVGSIPGVYLGARLSSGARDTLIRPALVFVLLGSGLKLVNVGTPQLAVIMLLFVMVALPIWGTIDAASRPAHHWEASGYSKRMWVGAQAFGAPFGVGFWASLMYFLRAKRKLQRAGVYSDVAVTGDEVGP